MVFSRRPHLLKSNKSQSRPRLHIFADVESRIGPVINDWRAHRFRLGQALFWRRRTDGKPDQMTWYYIESLEAFWRWVDDHTYDRTNTVLITHNLNYDLILLKAFSILPELDWQLTKFYSEQGCKIFNFKRDKRNLQFVDNANWFRGSLESWGRIIGFPKQRVDFDAVDDKTLAEYCKRDVEIMYRLWKAWYQFLDDHDTGAWGITVPSQAFHSYRHRFMDHPIYIHNNSDAMKLERAGYHGGRTEVFHTGSFDGDRYRKLDVNSMYPHVMKIHEYPTNLRGIAYKMNRRGLRYRLDRYAVMAHVKVDVDRPYFPVKIDDRLCYPVGEFKTVLTTPELELAYRLRWIKEIYTTTWYTKAPIFDRYIEYWYKLKVDYDRSHDHSRYALIKLLLNSLYGKFGQMSTTMEIIGECDPDLFDVVHFYDEDTRQWRSEYYIGGQVFVTLRADDSFHSFCAIAAHVTAYARLYLYDLVETVGRDNTFYVDTDSLIVGTEGFNALQPLIHPTRLGHLKIETSGDRLIIYSAKDYVIGDEVRIKGVRRDAKWLDSTTVEQDMFPSIKGLMSQEFGETYHTKRIVKRLSRRVLSGTVNPDGVVQPFTVQIEDIDNVLDLMTEPVE